MSKLLPSLSGVACFIWVSGWTWIFTEGKQATSDNSNPTPINILLDSVRYEVQHPFAFELDEATPIVNEQLHPALKSIVKKLKKHPKQSLTITGIFATTEVNESRFANLGIARAEAVRSMLETAGAATDRIKAVGMEVANLFQTDDKLMGVIYFSYSSNEVEEQADIETAEPLEHREDAGEVQVFKYKYGDYKVEKRHFDFLNNLRRQLRDNPDSKVTLTGYSTAEEEAESSRVNLAEMRALAIRRYLIDHGTRRAQIEAKAKPSMAQGSEEMIVSIQVTED